MDEKKKTVLCLCCQPFCIKAVRIMELRPTEVWTAAHTHDIVRDVAFTHEGKMGLPIWQNLLEFEKAIHTLTYDYFYLYAHKRFYMTVVDAELRKKGEWGAVWFTLDEVANYESDELMELAINRKLGASPDDLDCFRYPELYFSN